MWNNLILFLSFYISLYFCTYRYFFKEIVLGILTSFSTLNYLLFSNLHQKIMHALKWLKISHFACQSESVTSIEFSNCSFWVSRADIIANIICQTINCISIIWIITNQMLCLTNFIVNWWRSGSFVFCVTTDVYFVQDIWCFKLASFYTQLGSSFLAQIR